MLQGREKAEGVHDDDSTFDDHGGAGPEGGLGGASATMLQARYPLRKNTDNPRALQ